MEDRFGDDDIFNKPLNKFFEDIFDDDIFGEKKTIPQPQENIEFSPQFLSTQGTETSITTDVQSQFTNIVPLPTLEKITKVPEARQKPAGTISIPYKANSSHMLDFVPSAFDEYFCLFEPLSEKPESASVVIHRLNVRTAYTFKAVSKNYRPFWLSGDKTKILVRKADIEKVVHRFNEEKEQLGKAEQRKLEKEEYKCKQKLVREENKSKQISEIEDKIRKRKLEIEENKNGLSVSPRAIVTLELFNTDPAKQLLLEQFQSTAIIRPKRSKK